MFYSETLLSKTGPLAQVWLAANLERKLSKQNVLSSQIEKSVHEIVGQGQAPMALRLSGQLLLGVVRIYSRKARYLLDDCNEALLKIKMAFRAGNVDLSSNQLHPADPNALILPDVLTEADLFPTIDASLLLTQLGSIEDLIERPRGRSEDITLPEHTDSFLLPSPEKGRRGALARAEEEEEPELYDDDLPLDTGEDLVQTSMLTDAPSIEVGRGLTTPAAGPRDSMPSDAMGNDAFNLPDEPTGLINDDDTLMRDDDDMPRLDNDEELEGQTTPKPRTERAAPNITDPDASFGAGLDTTDLIPEDETTTASMKAEERRLARRQTKKQLGLDKDTFIPHAEYKHQQDDRSRILKPFALDAAPVNDYFAPTAAGIALAPELQDLISLDAIRGLAGFGGDGKRKRDSGIALNDSEEASPRSNKQLRLSPEHERLPTADDEFTVPTFDDEEPLLPPTGDDTNLAGLSLHSDPDRPLDEDEELTNHAGDFDETTVPLIHPGANGPISLGTKHAVHFLRDQFAEVAPDRSTVSPSKVRGGKGVISFGQMFPQSTTSRADATKMFFEVLVLATKDAVKVEQRSDAGLGGEIRVRPKRGLWGDWADVQESLPEVAAQ